MARWQWLFLSAVVVLLVAYLPTAFGPSLPSPRADPRPLELLTGDERLWHAMAEAARPEGRVVILTESVDLRERTGPAFAHRFGIDAEVVVARGPEIIARLESERAVGVHSFDIVITSLARMANVIHPAGWLSPIKPLVVHPEALDPSRWRDRQVPYHDPDGQYVLGTVESVQSAIAYNPLFVGELSLRSGDQLLSPELRGKMSTGDPLVPGRGRQLALYFLQAKGEDFVRRLYVDQEPGISRDQRQMSDWFARGRYPIMLSPQGLPRLIEDGFPVELTWPPDLQPMVGGGDSFIGALASGPHPNATTLFLNWILTRDGQQAFGSESIRLDVEPRALPELTPRSDVEYFNVDDWEFRTSGYEARLDRIRTLLGR